MQENTMNPEEFYAPLITEMHQKAVEADAIAMKKYMRNLFDFFGLKKPIREEITKKFTREYGIPDAKDVEAAVKYLWEQPQRELQYYAMLVADKRMKDGGGNMIHLLEYMILNKSWWDTVDFIAANSVGKYFKKYPGEIIPVTEKWMKSKNIWLQRSALLFQLKYKDQTDFDLLTKYIVYLENEKEFFIRKAIGWSLREYSKTAPEKVVQFIDHAAISDFSKKEGLKWLQKKAN